VAAGRKIAVVAAVSSLMLALAGCAPALSDPGPIDAGGPPAPAHDAGAGAGADLGVSVGVDAGQEAAGPMDEPPADAAALEAPQDNEASEDSAVAPTDAGAGADADLGHPPGGDDLAGNWAGTTSQGLAIRFSVVGAPGLDSWEFGWQLPDCGSTSRVSFPTPVPIVDGRLMRTEPAPAGLSTTLTIVFDTNDHATGTVDFTLTTVPGQPGCTGHATATFEATKGP
jgi:hypothetical protein